MAERALGAGDGGRRKAAEGVIHELIDAAFLALDESYVLRPMLAEAGTLPAATTRGPIAAALFVRNGGATLRRLLPEARPAAIVEYLGRRLDEAFARPTGPGPQQFGLEGLWQQRDLAARMVHLVLAECGGPDAAAP